SNKINLTNQPGSQSNQSGLSLLPQRQIDYLNDWSELQLLRTLNPGIIFNFNHQFELASFDRDPLYIYQWNLQQVNLEAALNAIGQDVKDVAVAVIDTGGPSVSSTAWNESNLIDGGFDFVYGDSNSVDFISTPSYTGSDNSHGTHVSTTIAAKNNSAGLNGYAVKALNINVFDRNPNKAVLTDSFKIINAINYAAGLSNSSGSIAPSSTPIKVINLSLKSRGNTSYLSALCQAVTDAVAQGITVVAAAGNDQDIDPGSISYPASCPGAISVGATNSAGEITGYSQQNAYVDISAPGGDYQDRNGDGIYDLVPAYTNDSDVVGLQGTSMASPQVSAAIALMYAVDDSMTPSRVESMLIAGELTDDRGASGRDDVFGYGELNIAKAIENVIEDTSSSTTFAYTSAPYLDFSSTTTQLNISLYKVGSSALSVTGLTADSATGLTYDDDAADVNGFGAYTIFVNRTSIPTGEFSNTIYFNLSDGDKVAVRLFYNVGTLRSRANIGKAFIGMYDASDDSLWGSVVTDVNGSVSFTANDVAPGDYYILTSTDIDGDNTVCDFGELCEYYPRISDTAEYFTVSDSDLTGYEIYLYPRYRYGGIEAASVKNNTNKKSDVINASAKSISIGEGLVSIKSLSDIPTGNSVNKGDKTFNIN
ncbi:MAG: S8 family serine peptidase, partial [Proteobacteria bacterium]|nr:S8 family serine peptidase [Pseudomonadota bacterium]